MECRYAFYTKPFNSDIRRNNTHWCDKSVEFYMLTYTSMRMREYGFRTVMHTDRYGKSLLDAMDIQFDEIVVDLDLCELKPRFWASGKVHAYTRGVGDFRPYIMCDNDAGFHSRPPQHILDSRYACQSLHVDTKTEFERQIYRVVEENKNEFPFDIFHWAVKYSDELKGANSGLVIMNDKDLFEEFTRYAWALFDSPFFDTILKKTTELSPYKALSKWNVLIEENLLYFLNKRMYGGNPTVLLDCTGFQIPKNTYNPHDYYHIWGSKKNPKIIREYKEMALTFINNSEKIENALNGRSNG